MTVGRLIQNLSSIDFREVVKDSIQATSPELVSLQQQQMTKGEAATGRKIGKYKSPAYAAKKYAQNQLAGKGNIDLRLAGTFQKHIKIFFFSRSFFFKSTDWKAELLEKKYGERIFGLNQQNKISYSNETLKPEAVKRIKSDILK